jgi:transcriptional regulator with XRE-family HTH domain
MAADTRIGTAIKRARERKRWTQRQLADALGVDIKTIDNWEHSRTRPRNRLGALEEVLGISLSTEQGPLADLAPPQDEWEARVFADPDLPDRIKRRFITDSRAARAAYPGPARGSAPPSQGQPERRMTAG